MVTPRLPRNKKPQENRHTILRLFEIGPSRYQHGPACLVRLSEDIVERLGDPPALVLLPTEQGVIMTIPNSSERDQPDSLNGPVWVNLYRKGDFYGAVVLRPEQIRRLDIEWINAYFAAETTPHGVLLRTKVPLTAAAINPTTGRFSQPVVSITPRRMKPVTDES